MANEKALEQLREDGFIPWVVERRLGSFVTSDFFLCADVYGHSSDPNRRDRLIQSCGEDVQPHFDKLLKGYTVAKLKKNKETGIHEVVNKEWPPNPYLSTLMAKLDFYIYSFVLRKEKRGGRATWQCRKWKAILSPEGNVSFELEVQ